MDIKKVSLPEQHYLYVEREAAINGSDMAEAMGSGFGEIFGFTQSKGIMPLSMPSSVYIEMPSDKIKFRTAVFVSAEDAAKAEGNVTAGTLAAGDALAATHKGPYASLNQSHKAIWDHADANNMPKAVPVWEVYVDDPTTVDEAELRTEIYRSLG